MSRRPVVLLTAAVVISVAAIAVAGVLDRETASETSINEAISIAGIESIAWPRQTTRPQPQPSMPTNAAPVADLVAGLEQRLAAEPDDVKGWVLLAQSYAFVADTHAAENAIAKAVALGYDEAELRNRVELASRSSAPRMAP